MFFLDAVKRRLISRVCTVYNSAPRLLQYHIKLLSAAGCGCEECEKFLLL